MVDQKRKTRGRARLEKQKILNRIEWKELLAKVERRVTGTNNLSSVQYAKGLEKHCVEYFNNDIALIKKGVFNHYRRIVKSPSKKDIVADYDNLIKDKLTGKDFRVPKIEQVALSMVWTIEDCNAWDKIPSNQAKQEKNMLLSLLGFNYVSRESYNKSDTALLKNATDFLFDAARQADQLRNEDCENERIVVEIHSAIGFHAAASKNDQKFTLAIKKCLQQGVCIIYVVQDIFECEDENEELNWYVKEGLSEEYGFYIKPKIFYKVLEHLRSVYLTIIKNFLDQNDSGLSEENIKSNIFVTKEYDSGIPHFQDAFTRVGIIKKVSKIGAREKEELGGYLLNPPENNENFMTGIVEFIQSENSEDQNMENSQWEVIDKSRWFLYGRIQKIRLRKIHEEDEERAIKPLFCKEISDVLLLSEHDRKSKLNKIFTKQLTKGE